MILPQGYYKKFFWKNLLLMKVTPIFDQAVFNLPQNVGERFHIHSKILKNTVPHLLSVEEKGGDIHHTVPLTDYFHEPRFSFFSEAVRRRAAPSLVSSIILTGLQSVPIIGLHPTIPTRRQAAGRSAPTFRIGVGI